MLFFTCIWHIKVKSPPHLIPVVMLFLNSRWHQNILKLTQQTEKRRWEFELEGASAASCLTLRGETFYSHNHHCEIFKFCCWCMWWKLDLLKYTFFVLILLIIVICVHIFTAGGCRHLYLLKYCFWSIILISWLLSVSVFVIFCIHFVTVSYIFGFCELQSRTTFIIYTCMAKHSWTSLDI